LHFCHSFYNNRYTSQFFSLSLHDALPILDFFPSEYEEMEQLESYIEEQNISPVQSENGYIEVPKDVVVYVADEGKVDYAVAFESPPMQKTVKQNMELEM